MKDIRSRRNLRQGVVNQVSDQLRTGRANKFVKLIQWIDCGFTGVVPDDDAGTGEVAVDVLVAGGVVIGVHGVGCVPGDIVRDAFLYRAAIRYAAPAGVVDVRLRRRFRLGHAPRPFASWALQRQRSLSHSLICSPIRSIRMTYSSKYPKKEKNLNGFSFDQIIKWQLFIWQDWEKKQQHEFAFLRQNLTEPEGAGLSAPLEMEEAFVRHCRRKKDKRSRLVAFLTASAIVDGSNLLMDLRPSKKVYIVLLGAGGNKKRKPYCIVYFELENWERKLRKETQLWKNIVLVRVRKY